MAGKKNNSSVIAIAVAALVALGGGAYYFMQKSDAPEMPQQEEMQAEVESTNSPDTVETAAGDATDKTPAPDMNTGDFVVEEGNPVVATVDGKDITRVDVYRFIQTMPANIQQLPATAVYPMAMDQVINTRIVQTKADNADIENTEEFKREMEIAKQQIARNLFLQKEVDDKISEASLKSAYKEYIAAIPDVEERRARHILVDTESKANAIMDKLKTGEKFEDLAKSLSMGPTGPKGGDLGYFAKKDMVPEFANVAFSMEKGAVSEKPVQTQFGWHVIKLEDIRERQKPSYEQVKPMIQAEKRREILDDLLQKWRKNADIKQFDINGKPLKDGANVIGIMPPEAKDQPKKDG